MNYKHILCIFICTYLFSLQANAGVLTSIPILTLITKELTGTEIPILTLVESGEAVHHFEISPKTLLMLSKQDLIIFNGLDLEQSLSILKSKPQFSKKIIEASNGISPILNKNGKPDPHAWHNPINLIKYIENIAQALTEKFPDKKKIFQNNSTILKNKILQWQKDKINIIKQFNKPLLIVTTHDGYRYLAQAFGITNLSLIEDHNGESLSAKTFTLKIKELKEFHYRSFFGDGSSKDKMLKSLSVTTNSLWGGLLWGETLPLDQAPPTLFEYLDHNFNTLQNAFKNIKN